jgi:hypothetical protein
MMKNNYVIAIAIMVFLLLVIIYDAPPQATENPDGNVSLCTQSCTSGYDATSNCAYNGCHLTGCGTSDEDIYNTLSQCQENLRGGERISIDEQSTRVVYKNPVREEQTINTPTKKTIVGGELFPQNSIVHKIVQTNFIQQLIQLFRSTE